MQLAEQMSSRMTWPIRGLAGLLKRLWLRWKKWGLFEQVLFAVSVMVLAAMFTMGSWANNRIRQDVINSSASAAVLYMESLVTPSVQEIGEKSELSAAVLTQLDLILNRPGMSDQILALNVWRPDGTLVYSEDRARLGQRFPPSPGFHKALEGKIGIGTERDDSDPVAANNERVLEVYSPIRSTIDGHVIGVSELYVPMAAIDTDLRNASILNWLIVGSAALLTMSIVFDIIRDGESTIETQRAQLALQIGELQRLLEQNEILRLRLQEANRSIADINERLLQQVGADLHDGPAQLLTFLTLRMNKLAPALTASLGPEGLDELNRLRTAVQDSLREVRTISTGLVLPQLESASLARTVELAVELHKERTSSEVELLCRGLEVVECPVSVKVCIFRLLQEALSNAFRHAGGLGQRVVVEAGPLLRIIVSDSGGVVAKPTNTSGLGIVGMRARVEALGGTFEWHTRPGHGTRVEARFNLDELAS